MAVPRGRRVGGERPGARGGAASGRSGSSSPAGPRRSARGPPRAVRLRCPRRGRWWPGGGSLQAQPLKFLHMPGGCAVLEEDDDVADVLRAEVDEKAGDAVDVDPVHVLPHAPGVHVARAELAEGGKRTPRPAGRHRRAPARADSRSRRRRASALLSVPGTRPDGWNQAGRPTGPTWWGGDIAQADGCGTDKECPGRALEPQRRPRCAGCLRTPQRNPTPSTSPAGRHAVDVAGGPGTPAISYR